MTMRSKKENTNPEFGLDSRYNSKEEAKKESLALLQARLERMKSVSEADILKAKLMQLKFKMENYLKNSDAVSGQNFNFFLETYIDILYPKRIDFAADLNITANYLSKIINRHRAANDLFILKLMIHSGKVYEQVCRFKVEIWYEIYYREKISETMKKQDEWGPELGKEIKIKKIVS